MKRSGFKARKSPLRAKTPLRGAQRLKRASKQPISKLQKLIWDECKRIVRSRYKDCYTCPAKNLKGSDAQTGHGPWPKSVLNAYLKYDLRVLRLQCALCNRWRDGMSYEFGKRLLAEIGPEAMARLEKDRGVTVKAYDHYAKILEQYRKI